MLGGVWIAAQSCAPLGDIAGALDYLGEALAEGDSACLAFALAAIAQAHGIALVAVYPLPQKENAPGGAFVGLPGACSGGADEGADDARHFSG